MFLMGTSAVVDLSLWPLLLRHVRYKYKYFCYLLSFFVTYFHSYFSVPQIKIKIEIKIKIKITNKNNILRSKHAAIFHTIYIIFKFYLFLLLFHRLNIVTMLCSHTFNTVFFFFCIIKSFVIIYGNIALLEMSLLNYN